MQRSTSRLLGGLLLALAAMGLLPSVSHADESTAPIAVIVTLGDADPAGAAADLAALTGAEVTHVYRHALQGFAAASRRAPSTSCGPIRASCWSSSIGWYS